MSEAVASPGHFGHRVISIQYRRFELKITDDTKALVAARLTQAWAKRVEKKDLHTDADSINLVYNAYAQFLEKLHEAKPTQRKGTVDVNR